MPITVPKDMIKNKTYEDKNHFKLVYEHIIKPAIIENGWNPIYPKIKGSEIIIGDIIKHLLTSEMTVCDISILNPNVFYETGIRTALNKPIAYIKDDTIKSIPFDTSGINHETYRKSLKVNHAKEDVEKLKEHFKNTYEKSPNENPAWKKFGLQIQAEQPISTDNPLNAKFDLLLNKVEFIQSSVDNLNKIQYSTPIVHKPIDTFAFTDKLKDILVSKNLPFEYYVDKGDYVVNIFDEKQQSNYLQITGDFQQLSNEYGISIVVEIYKDRSKTYLIDTMIFS